MKRPNSRSTLSPMLLLVLLLPLLAACGSPNAPSTGAAVTPGAAEPDSAASAPTPAETTVSDTSTTEPTAADTTNAPAGSAGGKVLRVHVITYPDVVDPQKSSFSNEISIVGLAYEGLTKLDNQLNAVPAAAEKWEFNSAGDVITFTLRSGLQYSDGSPLTAENFRYAIERNCDPNTAGQYQSSFFEIAGCADFATAPVTDTAALEAGRQKLAEGVQTPDEQTLVLNLTNPAPYFPYIAGLWPMYPVKQELVEQGGEDWWKDPANHVGNGPFTITRMEEDQLITLEANENYWEGRPKLDGLEYVYQKDTSVALEAYRAGQIDLMAPDPSQLPLIREDPVLSKELLIYPGANSYAWGFNLTKEPFNDKKVREAFAYAIDRQTYCEIVRNGDCVATLSWIPEGIPGALETDRYAYDPEKARQALAESSYGGPEGLPEIKLSYNSDDPAATPRVEWIAGQLRDGLGINVTLDPTDGKTLVDMRKNPETYPQACVFCNAWGQDYPDPQNWLSIYWTCDATFAQRVGYCNEEFDELTAAADVELDPDKRAELYQQAGEQLLEDLPGPFMYNLANIFLVKPEITGYTKTAADSQFVGQWGSLLTIDINR